MTNHADHGNAFRADGETFDYAPPPRFTAQQLDIAGRLTDDMKREAAAATIHIQRLASHMQQGFAAEALRDQAVSEAVANCKTALDQAIAYLTRNEQKQAA